jgi:hypothetical protein
MPVEFALGTDPATQRSELALFVPKEATREHGAQTRGRVDLKPYLPVSIKTENCVPPKVMLI